MKLWVDDVRPAPEGYKWCHSVFRAMKEIEFAEREIEEKRYFREDITDEDYIEIIDIDHDAGEYAQYGGDYIKLLDWLEETGRNYPIRIHSMNPVGVANMRAIIKRNGWREIR
jgi:hypothetical protein